MATALSPSRLHWRCAYPNLRSERRSLTIIHVFIFYANPEELPCHCALQATKALASAASSGDKDQCTKPRVDLLYKNAASEGPQHSGGSKTTQSTAHQAAPGALAAIAQPSMQPYLTQRPETELNDNRDYCMPKEDSLDEQLFKGHLDSSATPHGHSEAPCTETVHGGDSRYLHVLCCLFYGLEWQTFIGVINERSCPCQQVRFEKPCECSCGSLRVPAGQVL